MKDLQVRFGSGRDVLNAYWGYLSDGGLVLADHDVAVGDRVALDVRIDSTQTRYALTGMVVRRDPNAHQMVVRFSPGEPHDMLLTEALAETDNVPARRHRRHRVDRAGRVEGSGVELAARVVDISEEGCCVKLLAGDAVAAEVGRAVVVRWDGLGLAGRVVWSRHDERGIELDVAERPRLREYVRSLADPSRPASRA